MDERTIASTTRRSARLIPGALLCEGERNGAMHRDWRTSMTSLVEVLVRGVRGAAAALGVAACATLAPTAAHAASVIDLSEVGRNVAVPHVVVGSDGVVRAVWRSDGVPTSIVQYRTVAADGTPGVLIDLSDAAQNADDPRVAVGSDGVAHVVWTRSDGTSRRVQYRTVAADGTPSAVLDLSASGENADSPRIAVGGDGVARVVWNRSNGSNDIVQYRSVAADGTPGVVVDLSDTGQSAGQQQIVTGSDGVARVVWYRFDGSNWRVQYRSVAADGTPGAVIDLSASGQPASEPQVGVGSDGVARVVWRRYDGSHNIVQYRSMAADGTPGVVVDLSNAGEDAQVPQVAVAADGSARVVWWRSDGGPHRVVQHRSVAADGTAGALVDLSGPGQDAYEQQVAVGSDGVARAVWQRYDGSNWIVQYRSITADGTTGSVIDLSAAGRHAYLPKVAVGSDGIARVVWYRENGSNTIAQYTTVAPPVPSCSDGAVSVQAGSSVVVSLACSGVVSSRSIVSAPGTGTLGAIDQGAGTVTYTAPAGASGSDSFTFAASNAGGSSAAATIAVTITAVPPTPAPPPTSTPARTTLTGPGPFRLTRSLPVSWRAVDGSGSVDAFQVAYQRAVPTGTYGGWRVWKEATSETSGTFVGEWGSSYCFRSRARDVAGNWGAWSARRCSAIAVDDRQLVRRGFARRSDRRAMGGSYAIASRRGAQVELRGVRVRELRIVATTCRGCGAVEVLVGGRRIATVSFASSRTRYQQVLRVTRLARLTSGNVVIRSVRTGSPVRIDGLVVIKQ
jgi:hypothetical protein